jgi:hypothetical protein
MIETLFSMPGSPVKPMKSTVISIVPWYIREFKPGLIPGDFFIPPSEGEEPVCLTVRDSIHYVYLDHTRGSMRVIDPSYVVARSIVNDYNSAQMEATVGCHPGLFWVQGEYTPEQVKKNLAKELDLIKKIQLNWFEALVKVGDDDWEKTRQHFSISDFQRFAVKRIDPDNRRNRAWIMSSQPLVPQAEMTICPACGSDVVVGVVLCRYCRCVLDPVKYASMQFAQVNPGDIASAAMQKARQ